MSDTQRLSIPANTWTQLPATGNWLAQNPGQHVIYVQTSATAPAVTETSGHALQPRLSMSALSTQTHWLLCAVPTNIYYTVNDIT